MTAVTVNQKIISDGPIQSNHTLKDLMDHILGEVATEKEVITNVYIDGVEISLEEERKLSAHPVESFHNIDFTVKSSFELALETLDSCTSYIDIAIDKIRKLSFMYANNKSEEANNIFIDVIEIMDVFVQLISKIHSTIRIHLPDQQIKSKTIQDLEVHLLSILKALVPAKKRNDIIMLCDLLEYELIDNLTQWKIKAIPELKKLKEN